MLKRLQQELKECSDNEPVRKMVLIKKIQKLQKIQKLNQNIPKKNNLVCPNFLCSLYNIHLTNYNICPEYVFDDKIVILAKKIIGI